MRVLIVYPRAIAFRHARVQRYRAWLRALGLRLIVADDEVEAIDPRWCDERLALPPPERIDEAWPVLRAWLDRHRIDALVAQTEAGLLLGSLAARHAGVRGPSPRASYLCTNKLACRRALFTAGVPQPRFGLARSSADVRAFAGESGYPIVLKGVASAAQRLVTLVRSPRDVDAAIARVLAGLAASDDVAKLERFARAEPVELGCEPRREFLVEAFAPGAPVEADGLVAGSEVRSFGVVEQVHAGEPPFFIEGYLFPADRASDEIAGIERVAEAALAAVGLCDSGYSIEMRADGRDVRLIEVNGRLGIDEGFGDLFEATLGTQPALLAAQVARGVRPTWPTPTCRAAVAYRVCYSGGVVARAPLAGEVAQRSRDGLELAVHVAAGQVLPPASSPRVRPHVAHALATDPGSSRAAFERARHAVAGLDFEIVNAPAFSATG